MRTGQTTTGLLHLHHFEGTKERRLNLGMQIQSSKARKAQ